MNCWTNDLKEKGKKFVRNWNKKIKFATAKRIDEKAFEAGVSFAVNDIITGQSLVWRRASEIVSFLDKVTVILVKKPIENVWMEDEYSVQNVKDLTGFKLDVFIAGGFEWANLGKEIGSGATWSTAFPDAFPDEYNGCIKNVYGRGLLSMDVLNDAIKKHPSFIEAVKRQGFKVPDEFKP